MFFSSFFIERYYSRGLLLSGKTSTPITEISHVRSSGIAWSRLTVGNDVDRGCSPIDAHEMMTIQTTGPSMMYVWLRRSTHKKG